MVVPLEHDHLQLTLIDPERSLDDLIPIGLTNRPELAPHQAAVQETLTALRREKLNPRLPSVLLQIFQNRLISHEEIDTQMLLIAQSMGLGNLEDIKEQGGKASQALAALFKIEDMVVADATRAQSHLLSAAARVVQAQRSLRSALVTYNMNIEGLRQTKRVGNVLEMTFRPQEAVFCLKLLAMAEKEYFATVAKYNQAQFQLLHALGYPLGEISLFRRASRIEKVDTSRPVYPPPVGKGPPPPTR